MTETLPSNDFDRLLRSESKPVLIDVYAEKCPPCAGIAQAIDELADGLSDEARVVKMSRNEAEANGGAGNPLLKFMDERNIRGVPALLLFEGGELVASLTGGPRTRHSIQSWMEESLGMTFREAPTLHVERYGIVMDAIPANPAADPALEEFREEVVEALQPFFDEGLIDEFGFGVLTDDGRRKGLFFVSTPEAIEEIAAALPHYVIVNRAGERMTPPGVASARHWRREP